MLTIPIDLYEHQKLAVSQLKTGSILCGGVGSGKSLTALVYYLRAESPKDLYIITTAKKRNSGEWNDECSRLAISPSKVDSWNNLAKYKNATNAFFIFDEQRLVGSGAWVKAFLKIAKSNSWVLLSATPGDTWLDYIPVFVANGFYKNRTEFMYEHVVWNTFTKFPKVDKYIGTSKLMRLRNSILVKMDYKNPATSNVKDIFLPYNKEDYDLIIKHRFNPYTNVPVKDIAELCQLARKVVNSSESRLARIITLIKEHKRVIIFYNYNYELDILKQLIDYPNMVVAEYNGHKHEPVPTAESWVYLVQYTAGAEGWNCVETNTIIFYSLNYSYRIMVQAAGRIDRLNTPFTNLYYYRLMSQSSIDMAILKSLKDKRDFNEASFFRGKKVFS